MKNKKEKTKNHVNATVSCLLHFKSGKTLIHSEGVYEGPVEYLLKNVDKITPQVKAIFNLTVPIKKHNVKNNKKFQHKDFTITTKLITVVNNRKYKNKLVTSSDNKSLSECFHQSILNKLSGC